MPITGSFSRSAVNHASGVQTPLGGVLTGKAVGRIEFLHILGIPIKYEYCGLTHYLFLFTLKRLRPISRKTTINKQTNKYVTSMS